MNAHHIVSDPKICHGKPCFKGTRILVSTVLDSLAAGDSIQMLTREYPPLKKNDILGAIEYASWKFGKPLKEKI